MAPSSGSTRSAHEMSLARGHNRRQGCSATHGGVHNFTVGQRKGLGVASSSPLYVIQIKNDTRQVVVGKDEELYSRTLRRTV